MYKGKDDRRVRKPYVPPRVLATYSKEDLAEAIKPHGPAASYEDSGCGGGCGCGG